MLDCKGFSSTMDHRSTVSDESAKFSTPKAGREKNPTTMLPKGPATGRSSRWRPSFFTILALAALIYSIMTTANAGRSLMSSTRLAAETQLLQSVPLDQPELHWITEAEELNTLSDNHGIAVQHSPFDDNRLYVTTLSGRINAYSVDDGSLLWTFAPKSKVTTNPTTGLSEKWKVRCRSTISFGTLSILGGFLVYSVTDEPPKGSIAPAQSRVIALSLPDHELLWESKPLPGRAWTPIIYSNHNHQSLQYIAVTHNRHFDSDLRPADVLITESQTEGHITILEVRSGKLAWTEPETVHTAVPIGYGPLGIVKSPPLRKFIGQNSNDLVVWSSFADNEDAGVGRVYALQLPEFFNDPDPKKLISLFSTLIKDVVEWNAGTRPVFSKSGDMYIGVSQSQLRAWVSDTPYDHTSTWRTKFTYNSNDPWKGAPTEPLLSHDEHRIFAVSASNEIVALDALSGDYLWSVNSGNSHLSTIQVSPDDKLLCGIHSIDGGVVCWDQLDGREMWSLSCLTFQENCIGPVSGTFVIGSKEDLQFLAYASADRVVALKLGGDDVKDEIDPMPIMQPVAPSSAPVPDEESTLPDVAEDTPEATLPNIAENIPKSPKAPLTPEAAQAGSDNSQIRNSGSESGSRLSMIAAILILVFAVLIAFGAVAFLFVFYRSRKKITSSKFTKSDSDGDFAEPRYNRPGDSLMTALRTLSSSSGSEDSPDPSRSFSFGNGSMVGNTTESFAKYGPFNHLSPIAKAPPRSSGDVSPLVLASSPKSPYSFGASVNV